jgi:hypothetical protein
MPVTNFQSVISAQSVGTADVDKLAASFDKLSGAIDNSGKKSTELNQHPGWSDFAEKVRTGIENPLQAIGGAAQEALEAIGPLGAGVAAAGGIFAASGLAMFDASKSLGAYATEIQNTALRTGLTTKEVGQFSFAAKAAGQDVSVFEAGMRKLSQGLDDASEDGKKARAGLAEIGVSAYDSSGKLRPMSDIFVQVSEGLNRIEDPAKRNTEALKIFGRAGIELLPTILGLSQNLARAKELGFGPSEEEIGRWKRYQEQMAELSTEWEEISHEFKEPLAATFSILIRGATGDFSDVTGEAAQGLMAQIGKEALSDVERRFKALAESEMLSPLAQKRLADAITVERNKQVAAAFRQGMNGPFEPAWTGNVSTGGASFASGLTVDLSATKGAPPPISVDTSALSFASALAPMGDNRELVEARQKLQELQEDLQAKTELKAPYKDRADLAGQIEAQKALVARIEARIKATKDLATEERSLEGFEKQMSEKDLGPFSKIYAQAEKFPDFAGRAMSAATTGALSELSKSGMDLEGVMKILGGEGQMSRAISLVPYLPGAEEMKQDFQMALKTGQEAAKNWDAVYKTLDKTSAETVKNFLAAAAAAERVNAEIDRVELESARSEIIARSNRADRLQQLQMGPGREAEAAEAGYQQRILLAKQLFDFDKAMAEKDQSRLEMAQAWANLHKETYEADFEMEQKLADIQMQRLEKFKSFAEGGFNALLSGHLVGFAKSQAMGLADHVVGQAAGMAWPTVEKALPHTPEGSFWSKLLAGTPFGAKLASPEKLATDLNTQATIDNTAAIRSWAMPTAGGGGGGGLYSPVGSTFASLSSAAVSGSGETATETWGLPTEGMNSGGDSGEANETAKASAASSGAFSKIAGEAMALGAEGFGVYSGIRSGGMRGDLTAAGSALAMAGTLTKMLAPALTAIPVVGQIAGMALAMVPLLFGNPQQEREEAMQKTLVESRYTAPKSTTYTMDMQGQSYDSDVAGNVRPIVQVNVPVTVSTMDAQSFQGAAVDAISSVLEGAASARLSTALRNVSFPR